MNFTKRELDKIAAAAAPKIVERLLAAEKELRDVKGRLMEMEQRLENLPAQLAAGIEYDRKGRPFFREGGG